MKGNIKWFNSEKGYGFISDETGKDVFVHQSNIIMDGFRSLDEDDFVSFDLDSGNDGKVQAVNVTPILTMRMIKDALRKENLYIKTFTNVYDCRQYLVVDESNMLQSPEQGMGLIDLATYAGFDVEDLTA